MFVFSCDDTSRVVWYTFGRKSKFFIFKRIIVVNSLGWSLWQPKELPFEYYGNSKLCVTVNINYYVDIEAFSFGCLGNQSIDIKLMQVNCQITITILCPGWLRMYGGQGEKFWMVSCKNLVTRVRFILLILQKSWFSFF